EPGINNPVRARATVRPGVCLSRGKIDSDQIAAVFVGKRAAVSGSIRVAFDLAARPRMAAVRDAEVACPIVIGTADDLAVIIHLDKVVPTSRLHGKPPYA